MWRGIRDVYAALFVVLFSRCDHAMPLCRDTAKAVTFYCSSSIAAAFIVITRRRRLRDVV